jgi:hypothetical protein
MALVSRLPGRRRTDGHDCAHVLRPWLLASLGGALRVSVCVWLVSKPTGLARAASYGAMGVQVRFVGGADLIT